MRNRTQARAWLLTALLALTGCGDGQDDSGSEPESDQSNDAPTQAEVVVEPSEPTLVIDGEEREAVALVRELLTDNSVDYPVTAEIEIDEAYQPRTRVSFIVDLFTVSGPIDDTTAKTLADQTYDALAAAFAERAEAAMRSELSGLEAQAGALAEQTRQLQNELRDFQQRRRGLEETDASRLERRAFDVKIERALEQRITLDREIEQLRRRTDRGRFPTLVRIR